MWSIRVLSGQQAGQIYDLKLGKNVFGRGGVSDLKVQSLGISKEHCEIHVYKDKMMIVDLKSSNGTFVNGVKIQNSIVRVGDKISLFDVIMDVIPAPDIRPKSPPKQVMQNVPVSIQRPTPPVVPLGATQQMSYPQQGGAAMQMGYQQAPQMYQTPNQFTQNNQQPQQAAVPQLTFSEKVENYVENVVMPAIYRLGILFSFKQILQGFVIIFIFSVTLLSTIPLTNIVKESNLKEATKRAKSVARAMAKFNEQALLSGQLGNLSVSEAMKEEGIKEAFIIQQSDGLIVAPPEKAGRDESNPLVLIARKESRSAFARIDSSTIGASFPIAIYDPSSGEATPKYHAIVTYDVGSLNIDEGRIISLFMQTLIISSVLGLILYFLFARLIEFPIRTLNQQIDKALIDKSDRTEVPFDYPVFQKLVSNVNTILNRAWSGDGAGASQKPQQNKDLEFSNLVEMVSHPVIVVDADNRVVAVNVNFEQLAQTSKDAILNQSYQSITDNALVQNIDALVARSKQSPFEKQTDKIPFSQFECEIFCQAFLNADGEPQYFVLTLVQLAGQ
jgi:hypothetical protein